MGCGGSVASADAEGAFDCIRHDDVEKALLQKGVMFILRQSALVCANPVTSKAASLCLALRFPLIFCRLVVLVRGVWKDQTCGTMCWIMPSENLLHVGNRKE